MILDGFGFNPEADGNAIAAANTPNLDMLAEKYPQYGFEKHKGYGTKLHYEKLREFGPSEIHRLTFLKKMH